MRASELADQTARRLHGLLSKERRKRGLNELNGRDSLINAAERHSRNMARKNKLAHNLDGEGPKDRAPSRYRYVCENCAKTNRVDSPSKLAHDLKDQWMESHQHRKNLLRDRLKYDGLGVWIDGGDVYATHLMAGRSAGFGLFGGGATRRSARGVSLSSPINAASTVWTGLIEQVTPNGQLSLRERQLWYGGIYGGIGYFVAGLVATQSVSPLAQPLAAITRTASRYSALLDVESVRFMSMISDGELATVSAYLVQLTLSLRGLILVLAAILAAEAISNTTRLKYVVYNAATVTVGYIMLAAVSSGIFLGFVRSGMIVYTVIQGLLIGAIGGAVFWASRTFQE